MRSVVVAPDVKTTVCQGPYPGTEFAVAIGWWLEQLAEHIRVEMPRVDTNASRMRFRDCSSICVVCCAWRMLTRWAADYRSTV